MSSSDRQTLKQTSGIVAQVLRQHRYQHVPETGEAACECGVKAPMTVCDWHIRHHVSEQIAEALSGDA